MLRAQSVNIIEGLLPGYLDIQTPDMNQYVADQIFPQVPVAKISGKYPVIGSQDAKPQDTKYSGFGKPPSFSFSVSSGSFDCEPKWIDIDVAYDVLESAGDNEIDMAMIGAQKLSAIHADVKESAINTILTTNANFVGNATPSPLWSAASSNPIKDITDAVSVVTKASRGVKPNTLLMNLEVFMTLLSNSSMREIFNETSFIDQGRLRTFLTTAIPGITKLIVAGSSADTTAEGLTASNSWGLADDCWILYVPDNVSYGMPSYGIQPIYQTPLVEVIDDPKHRQVIYRAGQRYDLIVPNTNYGYRLAQVIT